MDIEIINKFYLELSQFATAKTAREIELNAEIIRLTKLLNATPPITVPDPGNLVLRGNKIFRPTGQQVIARGPELTVDDHLAGIKYVDEIAATGANAMRMLLTLDKANGQTPDGFDKVLARAASHKMIVWVSLYLWNQAVNEVSDALGGGHPAYGLVDVWQRQWLKDLMNKHRGTVIIDAVLEQKGSSDGDAVRLAAGQEAWAISAEKAIRFFRAQGYTQPLQVMGNIEGRDLSGIIRLGDRIRKADTVLVDGQPQIMFGWQAYWGTTNGWYPASQGEALLGKGQKLSAVQAMSQFVSKATFPIEMGFDNFPGDTNLDWKAQIDAAAALGLSWLWWSWERGAGTVKAPVSGTACQAYVLNSFKAASKT